jgi:hypothetical protein
MRERPVGLGHAVRVLALLDGVSPAVGCIEQLGREPLVIVFSLRSRAAEMIQRMPSACRRSVRTSTGT